MYTLSNKLKIGSIIFMVLGILGLAYGFIAAPSTVEDAANIMASEAEHGEHAVPAGEEDNLADHGVTEQYLEVTGHENAQEAEAEGEGHEGEHMEHLLHQLQARPWAAVFVSAFFFFMIALGALVFNAIQYVSQAGWSPVLYRVLEGITSYLLPGSIIVVLVAILAGTHFYPWMNEEIVAHDEILQGKAGYLNLPFFIIRAVIYLLGWNLYRYFARRNSLKQAEVSDYTPYKKNFKISVFFLLFFLITESTMAWDWFMSMTPHWYSTLFAWYIFASMFVSAITVIALVVIFLKRGGYLPFVNDSHLHDLAKFIFAFSIFWTYLWFAQFMLIWYANIPEEVAYFTMRIEEYNLLFFGMLVLNFVFPILMLMNTNFKRIPYFVVITGIILLIGHYIDIFLLVVPSTLGPNWAFGIPEIAGILFFLGLFVFVVGTGLGKVSLYPKGDPFLKESENYHY